MIFCFYHKKTITITMLIMAIVNILLELYVDFKIGSIFGWSTMEIIQKDFTWLLFGFCLIILSAFRLETYLLITLFLSLPWTLMMIIKQLPQTFDAVNFAFVSGLSAIVMLIILLLGLFLFYCNCFHYFIGKRKAISHEKNQ